MFVLYIDPFSSFIAVLAELFLFISLLVLSYNMYYNRFFFKKDLMFILAGTCVISLLSLLFILFVHKDIFFSSNPLQPLMTQLDIIIKVYTYSVTTVMSRWLVLFFSLIIIFFYNDNDNIRFSKICMLILWLDFFLLILFGLANFVYIFFVLEIIAIISVVLILIGSNSKATYNALLYFFLNVVFGGLFLLGLWYLYISYGRFDFSFISYAITIEKRSVSLGFLFLSFVFFFKLGAAPFHFWTLDVYEKLLLPVFLIFNVVLKIAVFILFVKIVVLFNFSSNFTIYVAFVLVSFLSLVFGIITPLIETRFFRVMLFSSLYVLGFSLLPLLSKTHGSYMLSFHFFFSYLFIFLFFFIQIAPITYSYKSINLTYNTDLGVMLSNTKYPIGLLYLTFFTMSSIPPLLMFWYKAFLFTLFASMFNYFVLIFLLIMSAISTFIYFRFVKILATDFSLKDFLYLFHIKHNFFNFLIFLSVFFFPYFITYFVFIFSVGLLF